MTAPPRVAPPAPASAFASLPARVLVVDDKPANLLTLEAVLEQSAVAVVRAVSGAEALARLQTDDFAVVVLDLHMPEMDGFEVARRIRENEAASGRVTPIIFLTAFETDVAQVHRAYASGAVDFVTKPFDPLILRSKVSVFVELYRKRQEAALRTRIERERDEANARERELRRMDRVKDEFLATLAHELRNPLMALLAAAELLDRQHVDNPALARLHGIVRSQIVHLRRLVEDSLEISRFTQGKIEVRPRLIDVREVVEQAVELSRPAASARGLALAVHLPEAPVVVMGDEVRLAQVVSNLLDNGTKFTPAGGHVSVALEATANEAAVRVRDSGRGIAPDQLRRIFAPFVQSQAGDAARGGLGIGLALVKQLVHLHGGRVHAASEGSGRGAEFVVMLPLARSGSAAVAAVLGVATATGAPAAAEDRKAPRARVLVVDDNAEIRSTVQVFLQLEGHAVLTADSGRAALDRIADADPDVVLVDIGLPDLDGYLLAQRVRAARGDRRPRLVAMTGNVGSRERERALRAGFDAHLPKPIDGRTLLRAISPSSS